MEKLFKIYVYEEGELPLFHDGPCKNIYSSEGSLFRDLEFYDIYRTKDSDEALVFFLPFSVVKLVEYLFVPGDYRIPGIERTVVDYINTVSTKYPFWNRSLGADHFMLACHDWGPKTSKFVPNLFNKSIRVLCNANTSEGFNPSKDVTLPGLYLTGKLGGLLGGLSPSHRSILAFFAGGEHGHIRSLLFQHWKNSTDRDIQVHEYLPAGVSYSSMMRKSKFCLCPSGYEVGSPRIVEAIYAGCVPVIIKDGYVPPFSDVLNWKTFSVKVEVKEIPNLKKILMNISQRQYLRMQRRVKQVQRHFVVNETPKRFDIFHMTVHSIWLRRLNTETFKSMNTSLRVFRTILKSKLCLCPSGYEVGSPRIVEAIYAGCVPVIIKDGYVPPFSDALNWKTFSVKVEVKEIPNLKNILMNISQRQYSKLKKLEVSLARARSFIRQAALIRNLTSTHQDPDYVPRGPIYRNANAFHRSYLEMEKRFKIYVYEEGELPLFHDGPCKNIYSSEGSLFRDLEFYNIYRTKDYDKAMVFFLPFSVTKLVQYLYVPGDYKLPDIGRTVVDYINTISIKYPFWNISLGADHFMLACHDWGPQTSKFVPNLFNKSIRVLCNANTSEGFNPSKDVTLPELYLRTGKIGDLLGGLSPSHRSILAFFAGGEHGYIRSLLFQHWKNNKDRDIQVYEYLPMGVSYKSLMRKSKFCLCPSGYEVASPRIVEAIYAGCVPVIINDGYVPPFSDVLNWMTFSVNVEVKEIPNLKKILINISQRRYLRMQRRVKQVQRHFVVNETPKRFDIFHMTVHSIWLRRLNVQIKDFDD
ncbi:hypothetical protein Ddye_015239 [Dipteronia dyeriana]|uniref:Exostosin GT47 domain-containing protein n=1 Tax=Dipteronia dyeriana TaxID=168575 RepID=A0AAD9U4G6_9ROSI|nr:hypothetical protein Ddye_015239 [Dipteronia dyeriana]